MLGADPGIAKREGHNIRVSYAVPLYRGMPPPPRILVAFSCSEIASSAIRGVRGWGGEVPCTSICLSIVYQHLMFEHDCRLRCIATIDTDVGRWFGLGGRQQ